MRGCAAERKMEQVISLPHADPGTPDLASPTAYLRWVGAGQWRTLVVAIAFGIVWLVEPGALPGRDGQGHRRGHHRRRRRLARCCGAASSWGSSLSARSPAPCGTSTPSPTGCRAPSARRSSSATRPADTGEALTRTVPTGDVVATVSSDAMRIGGLYDVTARFAGAVVSYVVVALILLRASTPLGLVVLIGVPVLVACLTFIVRPLQARQLAQREESGRLIGLGADTVAGLRVLRGIGGEHTFLSRYAVQSQSVRRVGNRVAGYQAALDAAQVLLPGSSSSSSCGWGRASPSTGEITAGQLVAFYGYTAFLVIPLRTATEMVDRATRAHIGARKLTDPARRARRQQAPETRSRCRADRPGSSTPAVASPSSRAASPSSCRRARRSPRPSPTGSAASAPARPTCALGGTRLADASLAEVRRRIVVSETDPRLFTGTLRDELDPWGDHDDATHPRGALRRERRRRARGPARRPRQRGRGARPRLLRRPAPAPRADPRAAHRRRDPRARRADERRRRPHRGPHRRAPQPRLAPAARRSSCRRARSSSTRPTTSSSCAGARSPRPAPTSG